MSKRDDANELLHESGMKLAGSVQTLRDLADELEADAAEARAASRASRDQAQDIERAWKRWDLDELVRLRVLNRAEADDVEWALEFLEE